MPGQTPGIFSNLLGEASQTNHSPSLGYQKRKTGTVTIRHILCALRTRRRSLSGSFGWFLSETKNWKKKKGGEEEGAKARHFGHEKDGYGDSLSPWAWSQRAHHHIFL